MSKDVDSQRPVQLNREIILESSRQIFHREGLGALTLSPDSPMQIRGWCFLGCSDVGALWARWNLRPLMSCPFH